jgi:hypothetical protein
MQEHNKPLKIKVISMISTKPYEHGSSQAVRREACGYFNGFQHLRQNALLPVPKHPYEPANIDNDQGLSWSQRL